MFENKASKRGLTAEKLRNPGSGAFGEIGYDVESVLKSIFDFRDTDNPVCADLLSGFNCRRRLN